MVETRKGLAAAEPDSPERLPPEIWDNILKNTHASAAIVGAASIDDKLAQLIGKRFPNLSNTLREKLFTGYGPLSSFSVRIDIALAFGIIDSEMKSDLDAIRQIRNAFAHSPETLGLLSPGPFKWLKCLRGYTAAREPLSFLILKLEEIQERLDPATRRLARALAAATSKPPSGSPESSPSHQRPDPDDIDIDAAKPPRSSQE